MRVVLNLVPVCSGGGQQQAFHLLNWLEAQDAETRREWLVLVGEGTLLHDKLAERSGLNWRSLSRSYLRRTYFDLFQSRRLVGEFGADIVLHFTGAWRSIQVPQVVRSVYSNLYFPEMAFWPSRPRYRYLKKKFIDAFRLRGTLRADGLVLENRAMQRRATSIFGFPAERTRYIGPSIGRILALGGEHPRVHGSGEFRVLYLTTWHMNKNVHALPAVAAELRKVGTRVRFILSLDADTPEVYEHVVTQSEALGVLDDFEFIGAVHPQQVPAVIESVDCLILLSQLECFSANVTEAWAFSKPLIISNLEWAASECGNAALYVDRDDPVSISVAIHRLSLDSDLRAELASNGVEMLSRFNTHESRFQQMIEFMEYICELGKKG